MANQDTRQASPAGSIDSLFDARQASSSPSPATSNIPAASRSVPAVVEGLYLLKDVLSEEYVEQLLERVQRAAYFDAPRGIDQVMLFGKARSHQGEAEQQSGLPSWATELLAVLEEKTQARLDAATHCLLFNARCGSASTDAEQSAPAQRVKRRKIKADVAHTRASSEPNSSSEPRARQTILNFYAPGTGISSHCDLPGRYDDGIIGLSLGSGCVMDFTRICRPNSEELEGASLYLPTNSLVILTGPARWQWKHGIASREGDWVADELRNEAVGTYGKARYIHRRARLSITARWMKPDAHVVGGACQVTRSEGTEKETCGVQKTPEEP